MTPCSIHGPYDLFTKWLCTTFPAKDEQGHPIADSYRIPARAASLCNKHLMRPMHLAGTVTDADGNTYPTDAAQPGRSDVLALVAVPQRPIEVPADPDAPTPEPVYPLRDALSAAIPDALTIHVNVSQHEIMARYPEFALGQVVPYIALGG
jgi:hypothetical protein